MSTFKARLEAQRKQHAERNASFVRAYKFKIGKTNLLILPGIKNSEEFWREYGAHYIKDPRDDSLVAVVGDAEICYGTKCPVRDAIREVIGQANDRGDDATAKAAKDWLAKPVFVMNALIISGVDTENKGKVVQLELSGSNFDKINSIMLDIIDQIPTSGIDNGFIITVERVGTGMTDTKYTFTPYLNQPETPVKAETMNHRLDLDVYVDAKFGESVQKALTHLSHVLGHDVTNSAIGSALAKTAKIGSSTTSTTPVVEDAIDTDFEDLLAGDDIPPFDASETTAPAKKAKVAKDDFDDIMADLDAI